MDNTAEVNEFLVSRRARVTPELAGLPRGTGRRVPGLRRSEVATLAGISVEYYTRIERGSLAGVSADVLDSLSRALLLDDAEREHLIALAQAAEPGSARLRRRRAPRWEPSAAVQWALDSFTDGPAFVRNGQMELLAWNLPARALYSDVFDWAEQHGEEPNLARHMFLDRTAENFYPDWDAFADQTVAILRTEAGRDPYNKDLHDLIGELSTRSDDFAERWGEHNVRHHGAGSKTFHHKEVGDVQLAYQGLLLEDSPHLTWTIYTAEPGSESAQRMRLLTSWMAEPSRSASPELR
ncbi:helix-turn-helix transcriptional regulator [Corynebacterium sp. S7]